MKRFYVITCALFIITALLQNSASAQAYINYSKYKGGGTDDDVIKMQVVNGETYVVGYTASADFPVTNGSTFKGYTDITVTKYSSNGSVIYSTLLGGNGGDYCTLMKVINGELYFVGTTYSTDYPVTNGSVLKGADDIVITKLNANGNIVFSTYLGGDGSFGFEYVTDFQITGDDMFLTGETESSHFPVTIGIATPGAFITKISTIDGSIVLSEIFENSLGRFQMYVQDGSVYLVGYTRSANLPVTIGNLPVVVNEWHNYTMKLNSSNFNIIYSRYIAGNDLDQVYASEVINGEVYLTGRTYSTDFPVTNGSLCSPALYDYDAFFTKLNTDGSIAFSTYIGTNDDDQFNFIKVVNGEIFLAGDGYISSAFPKKNLIVCKINATNSIAYSKKIGLIESGYLRSFEILDGNIFLAGDGALPYYPVTNNSQHYGDQTGFFTKLDPSGNILFSTFLGRMTSMLPMQAVNNKFYLLGSTNVAGYASTNGSTFNGSKDNILIILNPDGSNFFSGYIGGNDEELPVDMSIDNSDIYLTGTTTSANYPVTDNILQRGGKDQFLTKLSFCSDKYEITSDTLSPKIQTICRYGLAQKITGIEMIVPADSLPTIYHNGLPSQQNSLGGATYQWQIAYALSGPWANIPEATFKNYTAIVGTVDQYYRRLAFTPSSCGTTLMHISDTAAAFVNALTAPAVTIGGPFHTCPGSAINIGDSLAVTGGNPPYTSYAWDMGAAAVPNPSVAPDVNTIYTLIITDALGCKQIGQTVVLAHYADAGPDKTNCAGAAVKIGTAAIAGWPVIYDWQPGTALNNSSIAQPFANPVVPAEYELTLTVPKSGGGICITKDTVKVIPVAGPITPNIAGPDRVICLKDSVTIGTTAEAGFSYYWAPATYLVNDHHSIITYYPFPNFDMPIPNPAIITLTAQKQGCSFTDQTVVATIESRADLDGCGPRIVGLPDRTPDINETYSWVKISGPGNFTSVTNQPQVPVSASVGGSTVYGLTVSYNGGSCYSEVSVPELCMGGPVNGGGGCGMRIDTIARYHCPGYAVNNGDVTLIASSSIVNAVYTWAPQQGLSTYTGNVVHLTDNIPRVYTVTATDGTDPSIQCAKNIFVNDPVFIAPVFPAPDVATCANVPVSIGLPTVTGYNYVWTGAGLSNNFISNPVATVGSQALYQVDVANNTGCVLNDTVMVFVQNVAVNAGPDWVVCSNGTAKLGTTARPNTTYLWEPQASPWQNGTSQFSAQPEVLIATNVTFTVTATTSAGCVTTDQVNVVVNNSPTITDAPNKVICPGDYVTIGSPALPGVTYQWTPATGLNNPSIAQPLAYPTVSTSYSLLATFPGSCVVPATDQVTVTVSNPTFDLPNINFCPANGPIALGVGAPTGMTQYSWSPYQLVTNYLIPNPSTLNPPPNIPTTFTLRVRNTDGCYYTDSITVIPSIVAPIAGADKTICKNQTLAIGSASNITGPGIIYNWSPVTNLSDPTNPNPVFTATTGGVFTYILTKTDNSASCTSKDTIVITVTELLLPQINAPTICQNSCVQIGTTPVAGIQYQWAPATGLSNANIANPLACVGAVSASYILTATDINGCTASANVVVGVNTIPAPQITIPTVTACLGDNNATFNPVISPAGSYSYLWSPDNGTLNNINSANPGIIITGIGNTQYTLQVTNDITGCTSTAIGNLVVNSCQVLGIAGNFMWFDNNENGIQDPNELGVSGMNVKLYNNIGFNVSSTVTDANGIYYFGDIPPGNDYYAIFNKPADYTFTTQNVGGIAATNNSKVDLTGRSNNFNVASGANISDMDAGIKIRPIPISLLSFTAILHIKEVFLNWQTTAEYNNHYFDVERSNDGINFIAIGKINGNGTTSLPHNYSLIDPHPLTGINYYRLKQVDFDARYNYSNIVAVQLNNTEIVSAYYNGNTIEVIFNKKQDGINIILYGANGQLIKSVSTGENVTTYSLELPLLANGVYMLRIMNDKLNFTRKLFINKR